MDKIAKTPLIIFSALIIFSSLFRFLPATPNQSLLSFYNLSIFGIVASVFGLIGWAGLLLTIGLSFRKKPRGPMECENCKTPIPSTEDRFCRNCGNPIL
ncbi:MAG: hypothetical protein HND51_23235 [Chloroflexi bacterium]|nr:hypothetical protein [Chloroflexota bacterium]